MKNVYFVGIGGIGMSALARWFLHNGAAVAGYDRTRTPLTEQLEKEGAAIHYTDDPALIPFRHPADTVVVYTPAIPADHKELNWLREQGFTIEKRSQMLGHLTLDKQVIAVAGTHGKTSTTTMVAWFDHVMTARGSAFLGGISRNFGSNLLLGTGPRVAVEADEFDRSFLRLHPSVGVITSTDADHLDIYGTHEALKEAFTQFAAQITTALILKKGVDIPAAVRTYRYSFDEPCDFYASAAKPGTDGCYTFDLHTPGGVVTGCRLSIPGWVNVENAVAASAALWCALPAEEWDGEKLKQAMATFQGVKRRFEFHLNTPNRVYMDDYAHHPAELEAAIGSLRRIFPDRPITAVFQPHLYTRTRDFAPEFARALSKADRVILLPIYPAREQPIPNISSEMIGALLTVPWEMASKTDLSGRLEKTDVVATFGAGDIDTCIQAVFEALNLHA